MPHSEKPTTNTSSRLMKIDDLPPVLKAAILAHIPKAKDNQFDTAQGAHGWCLEASDEFLHTLEEHGIIDSPLRHYIFQPLNKNEAKEQEEDRFLDSFPFAPGGCHYHFAVKVGDIVIDWTARQFDARNPFPAIWKEPCETLEDIAETDKK